MSLPYYPAFINLNGKKCVVVGGGRVAERKIFLLIESGADITVVSPTLTRTLSNLRDKGAFFYLERTYRKSDVANAFLVIAATSDSKVNKRVSCDAPYLVNIIDAPELSNFNSAAYINKGLMTISVSTSGSCPPLASAIRDDLKDNYGKSVADFLAFMKDFRRKIIEDVKDSNVRHDLLSAAGSSDILNLLKTSGAEEAMKVVIGMYESVTKKTGTRVKGKTRLKCLK